MPTAVLENENATQNEVDVAVANIQKAMDDLVTVEDTTTEIPSTRSCRWKYDPDRTGNHNCQKRTQQKQGTLSPIAGLAAITLAGAALLFTHRKK